MHSLLYGYRYSMQLDFQQLNLIKPKVGLKSIQAQKDLSLYRLFDLRDGASIYMDAVYLVEDLN